MKLFSNIIGTYSLMYSVWKSYWMPINVISVVWCQYRRISPLKRLLPRRSSASKRSSVNAGRRPAERDFVSLRKLQYQIAKVEQRWFSEWGVKPRVEVTNAARCQVVVKRRKCGRDNSRTAPPVFCSQGSFAADHWCNRRRSRSRLRGYVQNFP